MFYFQFVVVLGTLGFYFQLVMFHCELTLLKHRVVQDLCLMFLVLPFAGVLFQNNEFISQGAGYIEVGFPIYDPPPF